MTQQDYEKQKRECWEEFCRANPSHNKSIFAKKTLEFAFDRAYGLGKQFGNSELVDVEKAAEKFADEIRIPASIPGVMVPFINGLAHDAYLQGAQDFIGKQESKQETVIQGWVARDEDGSLTLFYGSDKPSKKDNDDYWSAVFGNTLEYLPQEMFPDIKWEDAEPTKVEIIIKRKNKNL